MANAAGRERVEEGKPEPVKRSKELMQPPKGPGMLHVVQAWIHPVAVMTYRDLCGIVLRYC